MNRLSLVGEGVEIGVRDGDFSFWTSANWHGSKLNLIDPWPAQDSKLYLDISNVEQRDQDRRYGIVKTRMEMEYPRRHAMFRTFSVDVAKNFADNSLDYVYVDARHDYAGVKEDIEAWWPKLKAGGLFAGHDFVPDGIIKQGDFGVQQALHEFRTYMGSGSSNH